MTLPAVDLASASPSASPSIFRWGQGDCVFELHASDPDLLARAAVVFRPWAIPGTIAPATMSWTLARTSDGAGWHVSTKTGDTFTVKGDARRAVTSIEFRAVAALLDGPPDLLTFHAALVAREGRGLLILGPNEAGKSTLACHLWHAGFMLLGDDVAVVDAARGDARSAPRRVSLRMPSRALLGETLWSRVVAAPSSEGTIDGRVFHPDEVDGRARPDSVRLAAAVFLARNGASVPPGSAMRMSSAQALLALLPYSNLIRRMDAGAVIDRVAPLAAAVPVFDVGRGPLARMTEAVEHLLDGER